MNKITLKEFFNIPNCLCYFRIILIPVFFVFYFQAEGQMDYIISALILIVSGFTDFLDGYIARKYDMITDFGKLIDPIADKLTQFSVAVALISLYSRTETVFAMRRKTTTNVRFSKISTAIFDVTVIVLIGLHIPDSIVPTILITVCSILMFLSFVLYAKQIYEMIKGLKS